MTTTEIVSSDAVMIVIGQSVELFARASSIAADMATTMDTADTVSTAVATGTTMDGGSRRRHSLLELSLAARLPISRPQQLLRFTRQSASAQSMSTGARTGGSLTAFRTTATSRTMAHGRPAFHLMAAKRSQETHPCEAALKSRLIPWNEPCRMQVDDATLLPPALLSQLPSLPAAAPAVLIGRGHQRHERPEPRPARG